MIVIAAILAVGLIILLQFRIFKKHQFEGVEYNAYFSATEVYAGDYVYLYEELTNTGKYPITYLKADTELEEGLSFTFLEEEKTERKTSFASGKGKEVRNASPAGKQDKRSIRRADNVQSLFVVRPGTRIRRRWRVYCGKRGEYHLKGVMLTQGDILGFLRVSKRLDPKTSRRSVMTVLPVTERLAEKYTSSRYMCGDVISNRCPVTDPVRICGSREYTPLDPMNRVNWKSTAVHGKLMVNVEEKTVRHRFSVLLNMNSREIELHPEVPSDAGAIEKNAVCCASILERMAAEDIPVDLFLNTEPDAKNEMPPVSDDEVGQKIVKAGPFRGKRDVLWALRLLARLEMKISVPAERMFDYIIQNPALFTQNENLVVISAYLDERMLNMSRILRRHGVEVSFYITTSRNALGNIPADTDVYFVNI